MRFRIVLAVLLCGILSGCIFAPSKSSPYTGEPAELVVHIRRSAVAPQGVSTLAVAAQDAEPMHQVVVRIERGDIYRVFRVLDIPASETEAAVEVEVPSATGYTIAAFVHDDGLLLEEGVASQVAVSALSGGNVAVIELGPIEYELVKPETVYSGGKVNQFRAMVRNSAVLDNDAQFSSSVYNMVLMGLEPWSSFDGWHQLPQNSRWRSTESDRRFPEVTDTVDLYYQVRLCVPNDRVPEGVVRPCYYDPPMGSTLPSIELRPGPPPQ